jgi:uncharacterized protein YndB with AHSA1/START domain
MQRTVVTRVHFDRPPDAVMEYLRHLDNWPKFAEGVVDVDPRGGYLETGGEGSWTRKTGPSKSVNRFRVLELDPGSKLVLQVDEGGITATDETHLEPADGGTDATFRETLTAHSLGAKLLLAAFTPLIGGNLRRTYDRLKAEVEAPGIPAGAGQPGAG